MPNVANAYDVIIVGGGMVGAACALAAAQQGLHTALLEHQPPPKPDDSYSARVSAITRTSQHFLEQLDTWPLLQRCTPYQDLRVWEQSGTSEIHFQASDIGEPDLGHIVENHCILTALWQQMAQQDNLDIQLGKDIIALTQNNQGNTLVFADQTTLTAALIIGADGAKSQLRTLAQIGLDSHEYPQSALVTLVKTDSHQRPTAWQRFLPEGPLALLPVGRAHFAVVWSNTPDRTHSLETQLPETFEQAINQASQGCAGTLQLVRERQSFPLRRQTAQRYIKPGIALVGDAAHVIHPLAGQGVNLGFLDVHVLMDTLVQASTQREPLGRMGVLRRYERARKGHNQLIQHSMDGIHHLYTQQHPVFKKMRQLGFGIVNSSSALRRRFEQVALEGR